MKFGMLFLCPGGWDGRSVCSGSNQVCSWSLPIWEGELMLNYIKQEMWLSFSQLNYFCPFIRVPFSWNFRPTAIMDTVWVIPVSGTRSQFLTFNLLQFAVTDYYNSFLNYLLLINVCIDHFSLCINYNLTYKCYPHCDAAPCFCHCPSVVFM